MYSPVLLASRSARPVLAALSALSLALLGLVSTGSAALASGPASAPPCQASAGRIDLVGQPRLGQTVQVKLSSWRLEPGPVSYRYDWITGGVVAQSGVTPTFAVRETDAGLPLEVVVTATSQTNPACTVSSPRKSLAKSIGLALFNQPALSISGPAVAAGVLTAKLGRFAGDQPDQLSYRWLRDDQPIKKANRNTYTLTGDDLSHRISLRVTASGTNHSSLKVFSNVIGPVQAGKFSKVSVKIKGKARVGANLTAAPKSSGTVKATDFTYRWYRNGKAIKGATKSSYQVKSRDIGKRLRVRVTAKRDGFISRSANSKKTKKVPKLPLWVDARCMTDGAVICIDKNPKDRKVRYVVNGKVKMTLDARFGATGTPTREGIYSIYLKSRDHFSTLYDTRMPFAMFFSGGQAVHFSPDFAARGYNGASHGCVNIRDLNGVRKLFDRVKIGTKVVVYH